jgi:flagellar protein FlbD
MVRLTRLNHAPMVLNSDLIERIDITPDTVITLTNGEILRVRESAEEVVERIMEYRRHIYGRPEISGPKAVEPDEVPESEE